MITFNSLSILAKTGAVALAFAFASVAGPVQQPAHAASGGGAAAPIKCNQGYVYDEQQKICVQASLLDDEQLTDQGRRFALAGDYATALDILGTVRNQKDDVVLTYIGYAKRKLGMVEEGIAYYHEALALNPDNLNTREYLGEGYVAAGRTELAVAELQKLEALCGTDCDQYEQLQLAIAGTPESWQ
jgi:tetratricopeptide (TPR) repeat protein